MKRNDPQTLEAPQRIQSRKPDLLPESTVGALLAKRMLRIPATDRTTKKAPFRRLFCLQHGSRAVNYMFG